MSLLQTLKEVIRFRIARILDDRLAYVREELVD